MKAVQWLLFAIDLLPEVTWPGVGRFVKSSVPARLDRDGNIILPPTFSLTLKHGDTRVTDWKELLIKTGRLDPDVADRDFQAETEQLNHSISGQPVQLGRYGILSRSIENRIIFQAAGNIPSSNYRETYGLSSLPFTLGLPNVPEQVVPKVETLSEVNTAAPEVKQESRVQTIDLRKEGRKGRVWPFILAFLVLAGCAFVFWKYRANIYPSAPTNPDPIVQNTPVVDPDISIDTVLSTLPDQEKRSPEPSTETVIRNEETTDQVKETPIKVTGTGLTRGVHHIIVYESKNYDTALAKLQTLKVQYPLAEMSDGSNGRYMISIFHDQDQLKAAKEMARLKDVFRSSYRLAL